MGLFSYNSNHKIFTAILLVGWAVFHFLGSEDSDNRYENGQIKSKGAKVNSMNNGFWVWYHPNGQKKMQGKFDKGKRIGLWTTWDSNGNKILECNYLDDKLEGLYIVWNENGSEVERKYFKKDKQIR